MGNECRFIWLGDGWYQDWTEPPPPCQPGHTCSIPVGAGTAVLQTRVTDCVTANPGED